MAEEKKEATPEKMKEKILSTIAYWIAPDRRVSDPSQKKSADQGNFFIRIINGCNLEFPTIGLDTLAVRLNQTHQYVLMVNLEFFYDLSGPMKKLVLVHEAAHIVQRHIERGIDIQIRYPEPEQRQALRALSNFAMDMAANDQIVRLEPEFEKCLSSKEFNGILPEAYGLPRGLSFESYLALLMDDPHKFFTPGKDCECHKEDTEESDSEEGDNGTDTDDSGNDSSNESGDGGSDKEDSSNNGESEAGEGGDDSDLTGGVGKSNPSPNQGKPGKSKTKKEKGKGKDGKPQEVEIPDLHQAIMKSSKKHAKLFKKLAEEFDKTHGSHAPMHDLIDGLTAEQAIALGAKVRRQTKALVAQVVRTTEKLRGFIPGHIMADIAAIMAESVVPWHSVFEDIVASQIGGKIRETPASPDLTLMEESHLEPYPGNTLDPRFTVGWLMDCSGSVSTPEYAKAVAVMNSLMAHHAMVDCHFVEVDARIQYEEVTRSIEYDETKPRKRHGAGGTVYVSAFRRFLNRATQEDYDGFPMPDDAAPSIDLLIVATDGGVVIQGECFPDLHPGVPILWLISENGSVPYGVHDVAPDRVIKMFPTPDDEEST